MPIKRFKSTIDNYFRGTSNELLYNMLMENFMVSIAAAKSYLINYLFGRKMILFAESSY